MNNTDNNNIHKAFCYLILLTSAAVSLYLTVTFMHDLGKGIGIPLVFCAIGVVFDITKSYLPTLFTKMISRSQLTALLIGALCLALIAVSGAASILSIQNGIDIALSQSKSSQIALSKAEVLKNEIAGLTELRSTQLRINHVTKANQTTLLISQKNEELNALLDESLGANDDSLLSTFATEITWIVAIGLELITITTTLTLFHLTPKNTASNTATQSQTEPSATPVFTGETRETQPILRQNETLPEVTFQASTTREQTLENLKTAFVSGAVRPTHRSIWQHFKDTGAIKQKEIGSYLSELADRNILTRNGSGSYSLVTT
jgi:hypothetical protein